MKVRSREMRRLFQQKPQRCLAAQSGLRDVTRQASGAVTRRLRERGVIERRGMLEMKTDSAAEDEQCKRGNADLSKACRNVVACFVVVFTGKANLLVVM